MGPLGRLNACDRCGTPKTDIELEEFRQRFGNPAHSSFLFHYARLIELLYALERIGQLLEDRQILDTHVRATAGVNSMSGVGMVEAPRGVLIHHYKVNEDGGIVWANLIVATGHNNLAIGKSIQQVSEDLIDGNKLQEGMLNRVSAVVRADDPCFSCSTHASGQLAMKIRLFAPTARCSMSFAAASAVRQADEQFISLSRRAEHGVEAPLRNQRGAGSIGALRLALLAQGCDALH